MSTPIPTLAKAWRYPPDGSTWNRYYSLELRHVEVPRPGKGEVLDLAASRGQFAGISCTTGTDGGGLIPTGDGAGEIAAIGDGVTGWQLGDRVHTLLSQTWLAGPVKPEHLFAFLGSGVQGCLSQYQLFSSEFLLPVPDHLSYEEAAALTGSGVTAWNALFEKGSTNQNSTILVLGSGGVSVFAAQLAKAIGARVLAITSSEEKAQKFKQLGVDEVINRKKFPDWANEVKRLTDGRGVDQVIDIAEKGTLVESLKLIKPKGVVHRLNMANGESIEEVLQLLLMTEGNLSGVVAGGKDTVQKLDKFVIEHKLRPCVDSRIFGWTEAVEAFEYFENGYHFGKVAIRIE